MSDVSNIGLAAAFVAGFISFLSPCVLPLVPAYASFVAGHTLTDADYPEPASAKLSTLALSLCFVLGFSTVFIILGASATVIGQLLLRYRYEMNIIGGATVVAFGLLMTGTLKISWFQRNLGFYPRVRDGQPLGAYVLGAAFGFGWSPCVGPLLGAILTVSAITATISTGMLLLAVYAAGLGIPFIAFALCAGALTQRLKKVARIGRWLHLSAGIVIIGMGIAMMSGELTVFAFWLLKTFPVFAHIG